MIEIVPASRDEYEAALALLFDWLPAAEQQTSIADVLKALRRGRVAHHGLLTARENGLMVGSILYILQEDRTAFIWPPVAVAGTPAAAIEDTLLQEVIRQIESHNAWIGQCLIELARREARQTMERNGFKHLTDLRFLVRQFDSGSLPIPDASPGGDALEAVTYEPGVNESRFARLIEESYRETRDCPELEGTRTGEQALVSHRASGDFDPARWKLYRWRGSDAAVLLMNDHPDQAAWEVVYLGVARDCRGNRLAHRILSQGLLAARAAGRTAIVLAVDCRNNYAAKVYNDLGFAETDRRAVHLYLPKRRV